MVRTIRNYTNREEHRRAQEARPRQHATPVQDEYAVPEAKPQEGMSKGGLYEFGKGGYVAPLQDSQDGPVKWAVYNEDNERLRVTQYRKRAISMLKEYNETRTITVNKHAHITDDDE